MLTFRCGTNISFLRKRFYSLQESTEKAKFPKSYQDTVFLPKTTFPSHLKSGLVVARDKEVQQKAGFNELYSWQRENLKGKEFVLHDGPPYANGKPHIGHAINKILKDIILRAQVIQGNRVHYIPGWDCHGLPTEMVALKSMTSEKTPMNIRQAAREVATHVSKFQMEAFKNWGVLGDWDSQCYYTFDPKYVINELQVFWKLYEKGLIYHSLKPVYWSPSSQTALAESELIYHYHKDNGLTVRFEINQESATEPLYLLVWTTTPWTLPLNKAVFCSKNIKYSIVKISSNPGLYILATDLIKSLEKKLNKEIKEESSISADEIMKLTYKHPWNKTKVMKIFKSSNVVLAGTGLIHLVPGLGHDDYLMSLEHNLEVECHIDENGCFATELGPDLAGLNVLKEGSEYVIQKLSSDILLQEEYNHRYPYDWRTNQPVIVRASKQWFIDYMELKGRAQKSLEKLDSSLRQFQSMLQCRPYWCLSRQRTWGVPIPAFFHKTSGRPLLSKYLVNHLCNLIETSGTDVWWSEKIETLFPKKACEELMVKIEDVEKGKDIMDIWFDSGTSWSYVLSGKKSEVYLEGVDQYGGWFQSSLLTSAAVQNRPPFKKIMTHGYAVDKEGKKMSKSVGNVIDPESITQGNKALGVDTLRWWVGCHSHQRSVTASPDIFRSDFESVQKMRLVLRFLLGSLRDASEENLEKCSELATLDRYILNSCYHFYYKIMDFYNAFNIGQVCLNLMYFVSKEISSRYVYSVKNRLYCDELNSVQRRNCQYTINGILQTLCLTIAPVLPHLAEEVYMHHPVDTRRHSLFYSKCWTPPESWNDSSADESIKLIDEIKKEISHDTYLSKMSCCIEMDEEKYKVLKKMQDGNDISSNSELTEYLQVAEVELKIGERKVTLSPSEKFLCSRCRRYTAEKNYNLCMRCKSIISKLVQTRMQL